MIKQYKKINKKTAESLYNTFQEIYIIPCKCNINSIWFTGCSVINDGTRTFEQLVNQFIYYNCCNELGKHPAYYMEVEQ